MTNGESKEVILFDPPLWRQRRNKINDVLSDHKVTSVLDFGCGEGALISFLIQPSDENPITRLAGVDISIDILQSTLESCRPWVQDYEFLRLSPLSIDIYQGSIDEADKRLCGFEAVVCAEVIEHVDPPVLDKFFSVVLGTYKPKVLVITTPNVEFNVYFPQLKYGTPEATFRIEDHRFEWTRKEFQDWCLDGAQKYDYSVEFTGVGQLKDGDPAVGFATQIAIFEDLRPEMPPSSTTFGEYNLIENIVFPYFDEPEKTNAEIIEEIDYFLQFLCNRIPENGSTSEQSTTKNESQVSIDDLWEIHRLRQVCKTREKMREVLSSCSDFTLLSDEVVVVHKSYHLDKSDHHDVEREQYANNDNICSTENDWESIPESLNSEDKGYDINNFNAESSLDVIDDSWSNFVDDSWPDFEIATESATGWEED